MVQTTSGVQTPKTCTNPKPRTPKSLLLPLVQIMLVVLSVSLEAMTRRYQVRDLVTGLCEVNKHCAVEGVLSFGVVPDVVTVESVGAAVDQNVSTHA